MVLLRRSFNLRPAPGVPLPTASQEAPRPQGATCFRPSPMLWLKRSPRSAPKRILLVKKLWQTASMAAEGSRSVALLGADGRRGGIAEARAAGWPAVTVGSGHRGCVVAAHRPLPA